MLMNRSILERVRSKVKSRGWVVTAYLVYYHLYGLFYDLMHGTKFRRTSPAEQHGLNPSLATGNFPAHPRVLRRFLAYVPERNSVLDVGCGSGRALHVAANAGFSRLIGIELVPAHAAEAEVNLAKFGAEIIQEDALAIELPNVDLLTLYRPFPEAVAEAFLARNASKARYILLINYADTMAISGFDMVYSYRHPIYRNFRGCLWKNRT